MQRPLHAIVYIISAVVLACGDEYIAASEDGGTSPLEHDGSAAAIDGIPAPSTNPVVCVEGDGWTSVSPDLSLPEGFVYDNANYFGNLVVAEGHAYYMDGVREIDDGGCRIIAGIYANALFRWDLSADRLDVPRVTTMGGGSSGGGCLEPSYATDPAPSARHVYDAFAYVGVERAFYLVAGAYGRVNRDATEEAIAENQWARTWRLSLGDLRWTAFDSEPRGLFEGRVSGYESHLRWWPDGERLLWVDEDGDRFAQLDLREHRWEPFDADPAPFEEVAGGALHRALSTWDSKRARWVFHVAGQVASFDPATGSWERHADLSSIEWGTNAITYLTRYDRLLVVGARGRDTAIYDFDDDRWTPLEAGDPTFEPADTRFRYVDYDPVRNSVEMVSLGAGGFYRLKLSGCD